MANRHSSRTATSTEPAALRVYLSGPMRGQPNENLELFYARAKQLEDHGFVVFNPHELSRQLRLEHGLGEYEFGRLPFETFLRNDYKYVLQSDLVVVLPGWEKSVGAVKEVRVGHDIGIQAYTVEEALVFIHPRLGPGQAAKPVQLTETILEEANRLVHGLRQQAYGHPYDNDKRAAGMLKAKFGWNVKVSDVWQIMALVKLGREQHAPLRDTRVDVAGYAGVGDLVQQRIAAGASDDPFAP